MRILGQHCQSNPAFERASRRLERLRLVDRVTEPQRDRVTHLRPTPEGIRLVLALAGEQANIGRLIEGRRLAADRVGRPVLFRILSGRLAERRKGRTLSERDIDRLCARAEDLCREIAARDLGDSPLYIVPQSRLPQRLGRTSVNGYTNPFLDMHLRPARRDRLGLEEPRAMHGDQRPAAAGRHT